MIRIAGITLAVMMLIFTALTVVPGLAMGEEVEQDQEQVGQKREPVERNEDYSDLREERWEERTEEKLQRIEELLEEGLIDEEEAAEYTEALEERSYYERGECPADGPRNCDLNLNLGSNRDNENGEPGYGQGRQSGQSNGGGRNRL